MFARIGTFLAHRVGSMTTLLGEPRMETFRILQSVPGFAGVHVFANRPTGKTIAISLWETEAAARAWEQMRGPIVDEQLRPTGHSEQESATYELLFSSTGDARFLASATKSQSILVNHRTFTTSNPQF